MASKKRIDQVLDTLHEGLMSDTLSKYRFNAQTDPERIGLIEKGYGIVFPPSYRKFLEHFDGGMITEEPASYYQDMTDEEPDGIMDTSNSFFSLEKVHNQYEDWLLDDVYVDANYDGVYPFIPIGQATDKSFFFTLSQLSNHTESPIFMRHAGNKECSLISPCFSEFLAVYLKYDGFPPLPEKSISNECERMIEEYLRQIDTNSFDDPKNGIERCNALIELFPTDAWHYNKRGQYFQDLGENQKALKDFNHAVEMEGESAYFRYCRGYFHLNSGNPKLALLDLDLAVRFENQDPLYRYTRALALFELNYMSKALMECHAILDEEPNSLLALKLRDSILEAIKWKEEEESTQREREKKKNK